MTGVRPVTEAAPSVSPSEPSGRLDHLRQTMQDLSELGRRLDPVGLHFLEALATRLPAQPEPVRRRLEARLEVALAAYADRLERARAQADEEVAELLRQHPAQAREWRRLSAAGDRQGLRRLAASARRAHAETPLSTLSDHVRQATQGPDFSEPGSEGGHQDEMKSVRRFRAAWSRLQADDQLTRAMDRRPDNAGPLNSHMLVLRTLTLMRDLSPDYLRRFLEQVDTLLWLDQVGAVTAEVPEKGSRKSRGRLQDTAG